MSFPLSIICILQYCVFLSCFNGKLQHCYPDSLFLHAVLLQVQQYFFFSFSTITLIVNCHHLPEQPFLCLSTFSVMKYSPVSNLNLPFLSHRNLMTENCPSTALLFPSQPLSFNLLLPHLSLVSLSLSYNVSTYAPSIVGCK